MNVIRPSTPTNEHARLADLHLLALLDTPTEAAFDALARLAAHVAGTPIALISLVDEERQWFKASVGLDRKQTGRDVSFCGHVVAADRPLVVPETLDDARFHDNPLVVDEPGVRFYAGFPIGLNPTRPVGTLCVLDRTPRVLEPSVRAALEVIAGQVSALFVARRQAAQLAADQATLEVYRRYFELTPELLFTTDGDLRLCRLNPAWHSVMGYVPETLIGRPLPELLDADDRARLETALEALSRGASVPPFDVRCRRADGLWSTLSVTAAAAQEGYYMAAREVSQRRAEQAALADREARLRALFDALGDGIVVRSEGGAIIDCNAAAHDRFGLTRAQFLG
jgi:PAS domain S-box-containing protein